MLEVRNLKTMFSVGSHQVTAVDGVSFTVGSGRVMGIVGESGSGKSVTALSIMRLLPANGRVAGGDLIWNGRNMFALPEKEFARIRGSEIGLVFQNPLAALNPVFTIGNQMIETILLHHSVSKAEAKARAAALLKQVGIPDAEQRLNDYPHQFSMGMCQRIMIAITLAMSPKLLIADEPTASLDVTIGAQILDLMGQLRTDLGMSILIISHDLGLIAQHCDDVLIMYLGKIMEAGPIRSIFKNPCHPYTRALLSSIPIPDPDRPHRPQILKGEMPSPVHLPTGCRFHSRCPKRMPRCQTEAPQSYTVQDQVVACFLFESAVMQ